jgi:lipopolysaccharide/colanic/teichoic acid biosynthesis glycosyltransferase
MLRLMRDHGLGGDEELAICLHPTTAAAAELALTAARCAIPFRFLPDRETTNTLGAAERPTVHIASPMGEKGHFVKRMIDVTIAIAALVLLLPLNIIVALFIRLTSPGSAIFRQQRIGRDGRPFTIYKFRTMLEPSGLGANVPNERVTRVGRVLRKLSLDEIPQLVNVLKNEMSLVGPRPELPQIVAEYSPVERARLAVKPGITGAWQLSPYRGYPIHEHIHYDLCYIQNQSILLDIVLLIQTPFLAFRGS